MAAASPGVNRTTLPAVASNDRTIALLNDSTTIASWIKRAPPLGCTLATGAVQQPASVKVASTSKPTLAGPRVMTKTRIDAPLYVFAAGAGTPNTSFDANAVNAPAATLHPSVMSVLYRASAASSHLSCRRLCTPSTLE